MFEIINLFQCTTCGVNLHRGTMLELLSTRAVYRLNRYLYMVLKQGVLTIINTVLKTSSSSSFPTRWGQRPEFLISRMFCPGHPPG